MCDTVTVNTASHISIHANKWKDKAYNFGPGDLKTFGNYACIWICVIRVWSEDMIDQYFIYLEFSSAENEYGRPSIILIETTNVLFFPGTCVYGK
jgi:hypothetical protein